jgi:hypothetical protein
MTLMGVLHFLHYYLSMFWQLIGKQIFLCSQVSNMKRIGLARVQQYYATTFDVKVMQSSSPA